MFEISSSFTDRLTWLRPAKRYVPERLPARWQSCTALWKRPLDCSSRIQSMKSRPMRTSVRNNLEVFGLPTYERVASTLRRVEGPSDGSRMCGLQCSSRADEWQSLLVYTQAAAAFGRAGIRDRQRDRVMARVDNVRRHQGYPAAC